MVEDTAGIVEGLAYLDAMTGEISARCFDVGDHEDEVVTDPGSAVVIAVPCFAPQCPRMNAIAERFVRTAGCCPKRWEALGTRTGRFGVHGTAERANSLLKATPRSNPCGASTCAPGTSAPSAKLPSCYSTEHDRPDSAATARRWPLTGRRSVVVAVK
jgi:hypothetical protein